MTVQCQVFYIKMPTLVRQCNFLSASALTDLVIGSVDGIEQCFARQHCREPSVTSAVKLKRSQDAVIVIPPCSRPCL